MHIEIFRNGYQNSLDFGLVEVNENYGAWVIIEANFIVQVYFIRSRIFPHSAFDNSCCVYYIFQIISFAGINQQIVIGASQIPLKDFEIVAAVTVL